MRALLVCLSVWFAGVAIAAAAQPDYRYTPQYPQASQSVRPEPYRYVPPYPQPTPSYRRGGRVCGGFAGLGCKRGDYCAYQPGVCGRIADAAGVCQPRPRFCTRIYQPVCGCDGRTYPNACVAASYGASVSYSGQCRIYPRYR